MAKKPAYKELEQRIEKLQRQSSEHKQAGEAVEASTKKYRALVENSPDLIYILDPEGHLSYVGGAVDSLLGFEATELLGRHFLEIVWPDDLKKTQHHFNERRTGERATKGFQVRLSTRIGMEKHVHIKYLPVELYAFGVYDKPVSAKDKAFLGTYGVARDITDLKEAEKKLTESERKFRTLVEQIPAITYIASLDEAGTTQFVGPQVEEVLGLEPDEWKESRDIRFRQLHQDDRERVLAEVAASHASGNPFMSEYRMICRDGRVVWIHDEAIIVRDEYDNPACLQGVMLDITNRKLLEQDLQGYMEQLEEKVQERTRELQEAHIQLVRREKLVVLGQLSEALAHELRNSIGAVKNSAYLLNMVLEDPEPDVKESLHIIEKEVGRSEWVITSLLDFTRPKVPAQRDVNTNDTIREVLSCIPIPETIQVVSHLHEALPTVQADPDQLRQAFKNLILNAFQAMRQGGSLVVKSERQKPELVVVSFTDTGSGMDDDTLKQVFEPLFTTKTASMGLGLALTELLIEGNGGTVDVKSNMKKGTTFSVSLPVGGKRRD